jgi:hypothetical protein
MNAIVTADYNFTRLSHLSATARPAAEIAPTNVEFNVWKNKDSVVTITGKNIFARNYTEDFETEGSITNADIVYSNF